MFGHCLAFSGCHFVVSGFGVPGFARICNLLFQSHTAPSAANPVTWVCSLASMHSSVSMRSTIGHSVSRGGCSCIIETCSLSSIPRLSSSRLACTAGSPATLGSMDEPASSSGRVMTEVFRADALRTPSSHQSETPIIAYSAASGRPPSSSFQPGSKSTADLLIQEHDNSLQTHVVQWYPGHIARAERQLREHLKMVDAVLEVRDARIPVATSHPQVAAWVGDKLRLLVMNRVDMVSAADRKEWVAHFKATGQRVYWTDGKMGEGVRGLKNALEIASRDLNAKREKRGLKPRAVRACVIGAIGSCDRCMGAPD